jgi:hypothetical protein
MVSRQWAADNQHGLRLSRALARAHEWLGDAKNRTEAITILQHVTKSETRALEKVYDLYFAGESPYSANGAIDTAALARSIAMLGENGELDPKSAPKPGDLILPEALGGQRQKAAGGADETKCLRRQ